ncbi:MAG: hypothetical protein KatS3mg061_2743 [Dehalococcoidia bacterium]|nr:MAG: hypothetical protein KatS3mg061_2743 [Dehalococcoidia bacterium]
MEWVIRLGAGVVLVVLGLLSVLNALQQLLR